MKKKKKMAKRQKDNKVQFVIFPLDLKQKIVFIKFYYMHTKLQNM